MREREALDRPSVIAVVLVLLVVVALFFLNTSGWIATRTLFAEPLCGAIDPMFKAALEFEAPAATLEHDHRDHSGHGGHR